MQELFYKCILRSLSEAACAIDSHWRIKCFNRQAQQLTGINLKEALNAHFQDIFPSVGHKTLKSLIEQVMSLGKTLRGTHMHIINKTGEKIPVIANFAPVLNSNRTITGVVFVLQDNRQMELLRRQLRNAYTFGDFVTKNEHIHQMLEIMPSVAKSMSAVLIEGATGTGKELLAKAIHSDSPRKNRPFVAINCGALPDTLLESELFGYKQGAFTDAKQDKPGRFALAEKGTLFLDEIGEISNAMQVKLLRVLDEKKYEPLGGTQSISTDVRILAATNRNLNEMVSTETFRADLYYRLNVIEFKIPPLCERPEDIPLLLEHFLEILNAEKGRNVKQISPSALNRLSRYSYPGNVRELRNILEHAYVLCQGDIIDENCLPTRISPLSVSAQNNTRTGPPPTPLHRMPPEEQQKQILQKLKEHNGHRANTAEALGIDSSTLWRKMKKFELL